MEVPESTWDFILQYEPAIRKICRQSCRGREDLLDELWEEAVDRIPRIVEMWDPFYGVGIWTYVSKSLRMYLWKWMNANYRRLVRCEPINGSVGHYDPDPASALEVTFILEGLSDWDQWLLFTYYGQSFTFLEIGEVLGVSKGTVRLYVQASLARAQHRVRWRGPLHQHVKAVMNAKVGRTKHQGMDLG